MDDQLEKKNSIPTVLVFSLINEPATGVACVAIFWPTRDFKGRTFVSFGFSIEGEPNFCVRSTPLREWLYGLTWRETGMNLHKNRCMVFQQSVPRRLTARQLSTAILWQLGPQRLTARLDSCLQQILWQLGPQRLIARQLSTANLWQLGPQWLTARQLSTAIQW